ncbi:MAG: type II toxin-antitoxin system RelE/ParE family toxin [Spirochaetia bacterium]|jgi:toxin ParE1/3/4|nr:type II toxin-antitoxin system RelE/ParE family toxin [Spirochaetia bacterium]
MKSINIYLLPDAEEDLFDIYKYNDKQYSRENALRTIREIKKTIYNLSKYPNIGNIPPELERINITEYREVHSLPYRIIYQFLNEKIYINCILDARRDIKTLLLERGLR